jgi:hypothetical protein
LVKRQTIGTAAALASLLSLAACADATPIVLSARFTPPRGVSWLPADTSRAGGRAAGSCRIHLADIRDLRSDPQSMGMLQNRPVRSADSISWLRSGFDALSGDSRIGFVDGAAADNTDVVLRVELINAYVMGITSETRAVSVVLRVRYERGGAMLDEQVYRGRHDALTWGTGESETQASFDTALAQLLGTVDRDIVARCGASITAGAELR